jgi:hypothetical protein
VSERVRRYLAGGPTDGADPDVLIVERALQFYARAAGNEGLGRDPGVLALDRIRERLTANGPVRVGSEREGWRARLANVERLLASVDARDGVETVDELVGEALAEVRSMIDGDETTGAA